MSPPTENTNDRMGTDREAYFTRRKSASLAKLLPPYNMTVTAVAQMEGISEATLYNWRNQAKAERKLVPGADKITCNHPHQTSSGAKLVSRSVPGAWPTMRLNARLNAASDP